MQSLRVLARLKFLGALRGKRHWPIPKEVQETFEDNIMLALARRINKDPRTLSGTSLA